MSVAEPELSVDFFAAVLGWTVIAEPGGSFTGWVGDRLAAQVVAGQEGWRLFFGGDEPRALRANSFVDSGRVLHGPWAPPPRHGEPCWAELVTGTPDDEYWVRELGWAVRGDLFTSARHGDPRPVAGTATSPTAGEPRWGVFFAVDDLPAACQRVSELDGRVSSGPGLLPLGVTASIESPHGGGCVLLEKPAGWGGNRAG
ncbi:VOC family protein [Lentzea nigeriaca]|uniref:VOC family protein n=1 Tax=Lentzea nigeriaca TaxID=1128665 RepID=UPI00195C7A8C|nr:VOC family protein [Lentzea nigeriaca]MBM7862343.1 putative enzyme related to lactoylglutathione lyase [Lentzea nigeriaca]